jgi:hypothetical protein
MGAYGVLTERRTDFCSDQGAALVNSPMIGVEIVKFAIRILAVP